MTKPEWDELSGKQRWDCLVALRGPDIKRSESVKAITTAVIRHYMSPIMRVGGQVSDLGFVVLPSGRVFKKPVTTTASVWPDLDHFLGHVTEAAEILSIPIVYVPPEVWEGIAVAYVPVEGIKTFVRWVKETNPILTDEIKAKVEWLEGRGYY